MQFPIERKINWAAATLFFQMNYISGEQSIIAGILKLQPGHALIIKKNNVEVKQWYNLKEASNANTIEIGNYQQQQNKLEELLEESVRKRLISDVPLGAFLSGGIDSSVIVALAQRHTKKLNTFSIGFKDDSFFDETPYANLVAEKYKTNHTVFKLSNDDLFESLHELLDYTDEPFADSSALLVNVLTKFTKQKVTVALSGDGGDELFAGYNKHYGEWQARNGGLKSTMVKQLQPLWNVLPKSRSGNFANKFRQLERFSKGMSLSNAERYWQWCCFSSTQEVNSLLNGKVDNVLVDIINTRQQFTKHIQSNGTINDNLLADVHLVLAYDMLVKVDRMSMRNSLEVRTPFLDHNVVEYAFKLPVESKINATMKKKIVQDTFRKILPKELYNRPKSGFEVPLLQWFKTDLKTYIFDDVLQDDFIQDQRIFNLSHIQNLKKQMLSKNPHDVHAKIWSLIVFQNFYKKYIA